MCCRSALAIRFWSPPECAARRGRLPGVQPMRRGDRHRCQDPGAFLREAERRRTAIPHPLTGALAGPDDYGDLAFETHDRPPINTCQRMPPGCLLRKLTWGWCAETHVRSRRVLLLGCGPTRQPTLELVLKPQGCQ